jgi:hypothetical protein
MSRARALLAAALLPLTGLALQVSPGSAQATEPPCAPPVGSGLVVNEWVGSDAGGSWDVPDNWSLGTAPDMLSGSQLVCVDIAGTVTMAPFGGVEAHVGAFDLGGSTTLDIGEGDKLFANGDQDAVSSVARPATTIRLRGGTLGGTGRIDLGGRLEWTSLPPPAVSTITSRPCSLADPDPVLCPGPALPGEDRGVMHVLAGGLLLANGENVNLFDEYRLEVSGTLRLLGGASFVAADHGTGLDVLGGGRLDVANDGGWYEGRDPFALPLSWIVNGGVVVKSAGLGTSTLDAAFPGGEAGDVRVASGALALPDGVQGAVRVSAGQSYASGRCASGAGYGCGPVADGVDRQTSRVRVPAGDPGGAAVSLGEAARTVAGFGREFRVEASGLRRDRAHPALLELRYDVSVRSGRKPAQVDIWHQHGAAAFTKLPPCTSADRVPAHRLACVDRNGTGRSKVLADGDLLMVVRTTVFSRWVGR